MTDKNEVAKLITQLIRETSKGNIKWESVEPPRSLTYETEQSVPLFLQTVYRQKKIGIYDLRNKSFFDEHDFYWSESVGFCIVDDDERVLWELEVYFPALNDLFNVARLQASGFNSLLDD